MTVPQRQAIRCILLDIEGTITPISFVHEVLFPYARAEVEVYLENHLDSPEVLADIARLRDEHALDVQQGLKPPELREASRDERIASIVTYVHWLIARDRKSTGLKSLQGKIWQQGYADGLLRAPLYPDVLPAFERWRRAGLGIAIFSSGSVPAQRLLFAHTDAGDVTRLIGEYFDTNTGPKTVSESYRRIAASLRARPQAILFVSDVVAELDAAEAAGLKTLLCIRSGNPPQPETRHHKIHSFDEILKSA